MNEPLDTRILARFTPAVRDALVDALSRAVHLRSCARETWGALPSEPAVAWEDGDGGPELVALVGSTDELRELAMIGRCALGRGAPAEVASALAELAGLRPVDATLFEDGSLGRAVVDGGLDGLRVEDAGKRIEIVAWRAFRLGPDARVYGPHRTVLVLRRGDGEDPDWYLREDRQLDLHLGWALDPARIRGALLDVLGAPEEDPYAALIRGAMLPLRKGSLAAWLVEDVHALTGGSGAPVFEVACRERIVRLYWDSPAAGLDGGLRAVFRTAAMPSAGGSEEPLTEQEIYLGHLAPGDFVRNAPRGEELATARAAIEAWRGAVARAFLELAQRYEPDEMMPHDFVPRVPFVTRLARAWLELGPPGPRPTHVHVSEARLAELATTFRCERGSRPAEGGATWESVSLRVGRWTVRLSVALEDLMSILVELSEDGEHFVELAMNDPLSGPEVFAPMGDEIAFRDFATALRELVLRTGSDVEFRAPEDRASSDEDEDDEGSDVAVRLSSVLRFGDEHEAPLLDRRLEFDFAVGAAPVEIARRLREDPKGRAEWEESAELYVRCIRELFDERFEAPRIPW